MTYSKLMLSSMLDHLLIKPFKATRNVACSGTRTPYPQKHEQTLGATFTVLWKTASKLHKPGDSAVFTE